jgi:predicted  nucleic acid-binding Zn-ribbon protein
MPEECSYNWEAECANLKAELNHTHRRLAEAERIVAELHKELEVLKVTCDEQHDELIRYEAQIEAFKFVILKGR